MDSDSQEMSRLREIREDFAQMVAKAERDLTRVKARLEAARTKLNVADEMIASLGKPKPSGVAAFLGLGKYAQRSISDAVLDVINTHSDLDGMSVNEVRDVLINEGIKKKPNLLVAIHVVASRLEKKNLITVEQTESGKRFFKVTKTEKPQAAA